MADEMTPTRHELLAETESLLASIRHTKTTMLGLLLASTVLLLLWLGLLLRFVEQPIFYRLLLGSPCVINGVLWTIWAFSRLPRRSLHCSLDGDSEGLPDAASGYHHGLRRYDYFRFVLARNTRFAHLIELAAALQFVVMAIALSYLVVVL